MRSLERVNQRVADDGVVEVGRGAPTRCHGRGGAGVGWGHVTRRALGYVRRSEPIARWRDDRLHLALADAKLELAWPDVDRLRGQHQRTLAAVGFHPDAARMVRYARHLPRDLGAVPKHAYDRDGVRRVGGTAGARHRVLPHLDTRCDPRAALGELAEDMAHGIDRMPARNGHRVGAVLPNALPDPAVAALGDRVDDDPHVDGDDV